MNYLKQFLIILMISLAGEALRAVLPLPVPASIYGMVILFVCLATGLVKLEAVRETGKFLVGIMPVMFIPAGVGLMTSWGVLKPMFVPVSVVTVAVLVAVMAVSGRVAQMVINTSRKNGGAV